MHLFDLFLEQDNIVCELNPTEIDDQIFFGVRHIRLWMPIIAKIITITSIRV